MLEQFMKPVREPEPKKGNPKGFVVRDAPWSGHAPDTSNTEDFPELGQNTPKKAPIKWGPSVKR